MDPGNPHSESQPTAASPPPSHGSVLGRLTAPGSMIGAYRLLSILGEGGFGEVWLAERREPIVQRVAIKIIKPGMDSRAVIARFEQERQALAVMDHPNVARVFDAGTTDKGRPYFVMEYVSGESITAYCDRNRLTLRDRLVLFKTVCDAVQHAHLKGIIHRDLKPGNILIETIDQRPVAKVIDFGVAKAITGSLTDLTVYTEVGQVIGTPEYMSPEQAEMGGRDVDTRSDIYSLGVVLYELLTGFQPFDSRTLREKSYDEIRRIIREVDPPRPSTRILTWTGRRASAETTALAAEIARKRRVEPPDLVHALRQELEWIPLRAMRKDRSERYLTPVALAEDIQRYLDGQPLLAGPDSAAYKARKFLRRNQAAALTAGALVLALLLGLAGTAWGWQRAAREREIAVRAERDAKEAQAHALRDKEQAEATLKFLTDVLEDASAVQNRGRAFTVREMLDIAARRAGTQFKDNPRGRMAVRSVLGNAQLSLGLNDDAAAQLEEALQIARSEFGPESPEAGQSMFDLAVVFLTGKSEPALIARAESLLKEAITVYKARYGESDPRTARMVGMLAQFYSMQGNTSGQEQMYLESLRIMPHNWGKSIDDVRKDILAVVEKSNAYGAEGNWDDAQRVLLDYSKPYLSLPGMRRFFPDSTAILGGVFADRGFRFAGRAAILLALRVAEEEFKDSESQMANVSGLAADSLIRSGYPEEGVLLLEKWLAYERRELLADSAALAIRVSIGATVFGRAGRFDRSHELHTEARELAARHNAATQIEVNINYASTLRDQGRIDEAFRQGEENYEKAAATFGTANPLTRKVAKAMANLCRVKSDDRCFEAWNAKAKTP